MKSKNEPSIPIVELTYFFIDRVKKGLQLQGTEVTKELNAQVEMYLRVTYDSVKTDLNNETDLFIEKCASALSAYFNKEMELEQDPRKRLQILNDAWDVLGHVLIVNGIFIENLQELLSDSKVKEFVTGTKPTYAHVAVRWYRNIMGSQRSHKSSGCLFVLIIFFALFFGFAISYAFIF